MNTHYISIIYSSEDVGGMLWKPVRKLREFIKHRENHFGILNSNFSKNCLEFNFGIVPKNKLKLAPTSTHPLTN
jgi:hypothetical protein